MKSLTVSRKTKQKLNIKQRFSCGVGHVFNDLSRHLSMSFTIVFLMQVVKLPAFQAGVTLLIGQLADAFVSPLTGYLGDSVQIPFLSKKMGRRKSWHLVGTLVMTVTLPLFFNECLLCNKYRDVTWLQFAYYICIAAADSIAFNMVEINHVSIISNSAETVQEETALNAIRTVFCFMSGIYVYLIAWELLGEEGGDDLGPENLSQFAHLSWIATGTGVIFAIIFYICTKESNTNILLRRTETLSIGELLKSRQSVYSTVFESLDDNKTESSFLGQAFIEIPMPPGKRGERKLEARGETNEHAIGLRNTSLSQRSTIDQLPVDEDGNHHQDDSSSKGPQGSKRRVEKLTEASANDHRTECMVQQIQPEKFLLNLEGEFLGYEKDEMNKSEPEHSAKPCAHYSQETKKMEKMGGRTTMKALQRKGGVSLTPKDGHELGLFYLGYQSDVQITTKPETRKERKAKFFKEKRGSDRVETEAGAIKVSCKSAPAGSTPGMGNPKTVKDWLVDPYLYKVAVILTCSRLVQDAVYAYLPLYLTERLGFGMQAIAYFSLVLLVSAVLSSTVSDKVNTKVGSKWTYLLASFLVIGGSVYSYFQNPSLRQSTYAPVIMIGSGMSIMYVMALTFATGLIGKDKETSGSVFSIIVFIARLSSGAMFMIIQEFYPESPSKNKREYVRYVFSMVPGILAITGSLMVLLLQSSPLCSSRKEYSPTEEAASKTEASTTSFDAVLISKASCIL